LTRLGVLVSGRGTNLAAILEACAAGGIPGEVVFVASNKPGCPALEIARRAAVPTVRAFPLAEHGDLATRDGAMADALKEAGVELVITAGYDRVLDEGFVAVFEGRILNVHPSLLPEFGGSMNAIEDAYKARVPRTGVTVHLIEPGTVDAGRILAQEEVQIRPGDTLASLTERVHAVEHKLLPQSIKAFIDGGLVGSPAR
jgi:phosphoribosylglycinamide formyltransferase-1